MTAFIFTDKAQRMLGDAQGDLFSDAVIILACLAYLLYAALPVSGRKKRVDGLVIIGTLVFLTIFSTALIDHIRSLAQVRSMYSELIKAYQNEEYKIAEGIVKVIHREPEGGHDAGDIINIGGVTFELSCFSNTFGYNKTIVYGGVLTEGALARVFYYQTEDQSNYGRIILKIDLPESDDIPVKNINALLPCAG